MGVNNTGFAGGIAVLPQTEVETHRAAAGVVPGIGAEFAVAGGCHLQPLFARLRKIAVPAFVGIRGEQAADFGMGSIGLVFIVCRRAVHHWFQDGELLAQRGVNRGAIVGLGEAATGGKGDENVARHGILRGK